MHIKLYLIIGLFLYTTFLSQKLSASSNIDQVKKAISDKNVSWTAAESWVSQLSSEELKQLCGALPEAPDELESKFIRLSLIENLPENFDWRNNFGNWITPVKSQGGCGSCWAFSAVAQVESWWKIKNSNLDSVIDLSEQFVLSCSDGSCNGWQVSQALSFIESVGIPSEDCFNYYADDEIPCSDACDSWEDEAVTIPGWGYITLEEPIVENIKNALYRHPVSASYTVYEDFSYYSSGVYEHTWGEEVAGHAILIVGWNDLEQSWICKNSWGESWGEDGYFRIKWDNCGMGANIPFIYDSSISSTSLTVNPSIFEFDLSLGDSIIEQTIQLHNEGSAMLEYASIDYETPIAFHPDNFIMYEGNCWWCGDPEIGGYEDHWLQYLETPKIDISTSSQPKLGFQAYWSIEDIGGTEYPWDGWDGWNVWISIDGGSSFEVAQPTQPEYTCQSMWSFGNSEQGWNMGTGIPGWAGSSQEWTSIEFDITDFISDSLVVRFAFASDLGFCTRDDGTLFGLFIDEIKISDGENLLYHEDGEDINSMYRKGFGSKAADWIQLRNSVGVILPFDSMGVDLVINTTELSEGDYEAKIQINTNSENQDALIIPVQISLKAPVGLESVALEPLEQWQLSQNFPNPFNPITQFEYQVPYVSAIELSIFNIQGQLIKKIVNEFKLPGSYKAIWDGTNQNGQRVVSGTYFYSLKVGNQNLITRQMIFLK